jgi:hypothetical protein
MVDNLEQLLLCPRRAGLIAEVIQYEKRGILHFSEDFVIGGVAAGVEGGTQMVKEVRDADKKGWTALLQTMIGNGCGQMGLAAAVWSHKY